MYPLYMFAMYSQKETPKEDYSTYKIYDNDQEIKLDHWDFRKYTVLLNTIKQYDAIVAHGMIHPESQAIDKFVERLYLKNTRIHHHLKSRFKFSKEDLEHKFGLWISNRLEIDLSHLKIEKQTYVWTNALPELQHKILIYGGD